MNEPVASALRDVPLPGNDLDVAYSILRNSITGIDQNWPDRENLAPSALDSTATPEPSVVTALTDEELFSQAHMLARISSRKAGLNAWEIEDVAQEVLLEVLSTRSRNGKAIGGGLLRVASRAQVSRLVDTHRNHTDSTALRRWKLEVERLEGERRRHLTRTELDELADAIRRAWHDPRHRPTRGFHNEAREVSFDDLGPDFEHPTVESFVAEGGDAGHTLADKVESGEASRPNARRQLWNALASDFGTPQSVPCSVSESRSRAHALKIRDASEVAARFTSGLATASEVESLFAPFGLGLTESQRMTIAGVLSDRPEMGHRLWRSALDFANARYSDPVPPTAHHEAVTTVG
jgi:hypothetical protein